MTDHGEEAPVVVDIEDWPFARPVLDWAAAEATAMGRPLRLVHSLRWPLTRGAFRADGRGGSHGAIVEAAESALAEAVAHAQSAAPDVTVTSEVIVGAVAPTLLRESQDAELLVVGSRGRGRVAGSLMGSLSMSVVAHAPCPVVVVRSSEHAAAAGARVVVGTDGSQPSAYAIQFAFRAAARRQVGLVAVRVWSPPLSGYSRLVVGFDGLEAAERQQLLHALEASRQRFPEVDVEARLVSDHHAGRALVLESADADLVVVGTHGHGGLAGLLLGSVTRSVLEQVTCPVAVVRHSGEGGSQPAPRQADEATPKSA